MPDIEIVTRDDDRRKKEASDKAANGCLGIGCVTIVLFVLVALAVTIPLIVKLWKWAFA